MAHYGALMVPSGFQLSLPLTPLLFCPCILKRLVSSIINPHFLLKLDSFGFYLIPKEF